jgi:hypothetical protein
MKFTSKQLMLAALSIGIGLILFAVLSASLDFGLDPKTESDISTYGMIGGLAILLWSRKTRAQEEADARAKKEEEEKALQADTSSSAGNGISGDDTVLKDLE